VPRVASILGAIILTDNFRLPLPLGSFLASYIFRSPNVSCCVRLSLKVSPSVNTYEGSGVTAPLILKLGRARE
jgi:hypothetical protein